MKCKEEDTKVFVHLNFNKKVIWVAFGIRKTIMQKNTKLKVVQLKGASKIKKLRKVNNPKERMIPNPFSPNYFALTKNYKIQVGRLINEVKDRKRGIGPVKILFMCSEGIGNSPARSDCFNALARELGVSDIVWSSFSNANFNGFSRGEFETFSYVIPKYSGWGEGLSKRLSTMAHKPKILLEDTASPSALYAPEPYKKLMLTLLREIIASQRKLPSRKRAEQRIRYENIPWGRD